MKATAKKTQPLTHFEQLRYAREILQTEAQAVAALAGELGDAFCQAADTILTARGSVIVTGMGKAGLVGQKITATLASTGTPAHFLHPGEAVHGDLGRVTERDVVLILSFSGESEEVVRLLPTLRHMQVTTIAITGRPESTLAQYAHTTLQVGPLQEACSLGLAPSTSTTAMMALGDALALVVSRMRGFQPEDFARFHPAGSLGRKLAKVEEVMRPLAQCRVAKKTHTIRQVLVDVGRPGRRTGAVMLTGEAGARAGLVTDRDLAKLIEQRRYEELDAPIAQHMTSQPRTIRAGSLMGEAVSIMSERKISELPVIDEQGRPLGLIDITDVVSFPDAPSEDRDTSSTPRPAAAAEHPATISFPSKQQH